MSWDVESTETFDEWFDGLPKKQQRSIVAGVDLLEEEGPALGRPVVDSIKGSRHSNMKELRRGTLRVLFAFDTERSALLLIGGDKRDRWDDWYEEAIPEADVLMDEHLQRDR
jgi:hypothetical protein